MDARLATARLEQLAAESEERQRQQAERQLARAALEGAQQKLQLLERRQQALDEAMQATVVRAPAAGRVDFPPTLEAGRAIAPGEVVFSIRPGNADLVASAGMPPLAARRVVAGQQASVRLPGATAGDRVRLRGQVSDVSLSADGTSSWITVRIPAQMQRPSLHNPDTVPGRYPAEIVVDNENRALIQRLLDAL